MKRFVTYLYECERGKCSKNVGFIRVYVRGSEATMEIYVRNFLREDSEGKVFVLIQNEGLLGIKIGDIEIQNGQSESRFEFHTENLQESGYSFEDIIGIGIRMNRDTYLSSCWKDVCEEEIAKGEFVEWTPVIEKCETEEAVAGIQITEKMAGETKDSSKADSVTYEKIDLAQIRDLPSPNWHLSTNSFLVHGFWNYGYLVLKKELEENKEKISLGVPGIYEREEAFMAILFGFPSFEEIPQKNQEPKIGNLGAWFVELLG